MLATLIDITDIKKAEDRINVLARIPEENPNPVLRFDKTHELVYANKASDDLLSAIKCNLGDAAPTVWQSWFKEAVDSSLDEEREFDFDHHTYRVLLLRTDRNGSSV